MRVKCLYKKVIFYWGIKYASNRREKHPQRHALCSKHRAYTLRGGVSGRVSPDGQRLLLYVIWPDPFWRIGVRAYGVAKRKN